MSRLRGFKDLIQDGVHHGATAVQQIHERLAQRPFTALEQIPPLQAPTRSVKLIHDAVVTQVYDAIRGVNAAAGTAANWAIDATEARAHDDPGGE